MVLRYLILALYTGGLVLLGVRKRNPEAGSGNATGQASFFLGNRSLSAPALFFTLAATNFSAFTVLGLAGAGYRMGYSFYPAMAYGTGLMALGMYLIGIPLREGGLQRGWMTSVDAVRDRYGMATARIYALFVVIFTLPYLALQPIAAGYLLQSVWGIPYRTGALAVAMLIALYTARGGLKGITRTDAFNGIILFAIALAVWVGVRSQAGPLQSSAAGKPGNPWELLGYYFLWFMADPLFPQMNQRFLAASSPSALKRSVMVYPLITASLFFLTISTGVMGTVTVPGLAGAETDKVWLLAAGKAFRPLLSGVFALAPLSALVSTMDSQLLALSSIVDRERKLLRRRGEPEMRRPSHDGGMKIAVFIIAGTGALLAFFPPGDILAFLNRTSFLGYAALFPTLFGLFYSKKAGACGALSSMIAGEATVLALGAGFIEVRSIPHIFIVAGISALAWAFGNRFGRKCSPSAPTEATGTALKSRSLRAILPIRWAAAFALLTASTLLFFRGSSQLRTLAGLPLWLIWSAVATLALSFLYATLFRNTEAS
jgi:SSS family solute:Na+ symporter